MSQKQQHIWTLRGHSFCDQFSEGDGGQLLPPPDTSPDIPMCAACVMAAELYVAVAKGTVMASSGYTDSPAAAIDTLRKTPWSDVVDLDALVNECNDGRELVLYNRRFER
ncbi:hypothetical protein [Gordonia sp. NB41Y]|uniref:hypothetical protein n=1 Tax=Gordonia sp. NB41Y TaxID=875808 RepID=UPI0006B21316|nr:hypothetical protein [Gordonia sp. NB41Y]KOY50043.1 hypothetical protein ISGA_06225 [Gordonia sp. NB41Y]WLP91347.1 hypothetical protein Q9K23_03485 [Gordonia sp. NB41Y]